ncbi:hypothetical protein GCM10009849_29990 [Sinomonas flava]|uniref:Uncharacterized protein n=1 Tax=Sinomonas flava TaxID=496857 RepID=A0ABN3C0V4_9MICC
MMLCADDGTPSGSEGVGAALGEPVPVEPPGVVLPAVPPPEPVAGEAPGGAPVPEQPASARAMASSAQAAGRVER